ncbi:unnamed protein product [Mytilus coruscus]|uniref:DNA/RNA non-specific endonuclease domain-containing protein n=1 Tax=Mytilus coruscus TaxID=42192 RepID=A0A6J8BFI5_MYTCO|nr:unnamed protein product [Mytilus coruscus]
MPLCKLFATLYDTSSKIPIYSAYNIREYLVPQNEGFMRQWKEEKDLQNDEQASRVDYKGVGNDNLNRGHLAPRFYFHTIDGRKATDVLTNIAPQYDKFNQITWFYLEKTVYEASKSDCNNIGGVSYFLTGVLKSPDTQFNTHNNINIPSHFWTAVCCDTSRLNDEDKLKGWSFAYFAGNYNFPNNFIDIYTIEEFLKNWRIKTRIDLHRMATPMEDINFLRLAGLLIRIAPCAVRQRFDLEFNPDTLQRFLSTNRGKIEELRSKRVITKAQYDLLYPKASSGLSSETFDVSLMVCLMKDFTTLDIHDVLPNEQIHDIGADISRIKFYRNRVVPSNSGNVTKDEFTKTWNCVVEAILRLVPDLKPEIDALIGSPLTNVGDIKDVIRLEKELENTSRRLEKLEIENNNITGITFLLWY